MLCTSVQQVLKTAAVCPNTILMSCKSDQQQLSQCFCLLMQNIFYSLLSIVKLLFDSSSRAFTISIYHLDSMLDSQLMTSYYVMLLILNYCFLFNRHERSLKFDLISEARVLDCDVLMKQVIRPEWEQSSACSSF